MISPPTSAHRHTPEWKAMPFAMERRRTTGRMAWTCHHATKDPEHGTLRPCRGSNTFDALWQRGPDGTQNRPQQPCARQFRP